MSDNTIKYVWTVKNVFFLKRALFLVREFNFADNILGEMHVCCFCNASYTSLDCFLDHRVNCGCPKVKQVLPKTEPIISFDHEGTVFSSPQSQPNALNYKINSSLIDTTSPACTSSRIPDEAESSPVLQAFESPIRTDHKQPSDALSEDYEEFQSAQESAACHQSNESLILEVDAIKVEDPSTDWEVPENSVSDEVEIPAKDFGELASCLKHETIEETACPGQELVASGLSTYF